VTIAPSSTAPDTRRGRPRNEACTSDILEAAIAVVSEVGMAGLTMDSVAARAGVGKATIYRRWSSKEALMLDAWMSVVRSPATADTGALRTDLLQMLTGRDHPLADAVLQRVFPQMVAAAKVNPDVADAYRSFIAERRLPLMAVLQLAVERGEIHPSHDLDVVYDILVAPLMYRWLVTDAPIDDDVIRSIIDLALAGLALPRSR
jgi:AcrR family transcriptional regulator